MASFTEEQNMIRNMVRNLARDTIAPGAEQRDRDHSFPADEIKAMAELGLMGMLVSEEYGGSNAGYLSFSLAMEEIAVADGACSTIMSVHNSLSSMVIYKYGNEDQKQEWLPKLTTGEIIGAFALTEPQAGSDPTAMRTSAKKEGNHYILNGTKQFVTSGKYGGVVIVFAVTDSSAGKKGISAFIVPVKTDGYEVARIEDKMGQHCSDTCQINFNNMKIPAANLLGTEGEGYKIALANLEGGRLGIASQSVGMARAAFDASVQYAKERETFGKSIIDHQAVGFKLADMATQIEAARLLVHNAARLRDENKLCTKEACMAKLFAADMAERVASHAIQIHGGYGYLSDFPVERIYRDVRVSSIYEGTSDIQRLVITREIKKETA